MSCLPKVSVDQPVRWIIEQEARIDAALPPGSRTTRYGIDRKTITRWLHIDRSITAQELQQVERSRALMLYRHHVVYAYGYHRLQSQLLYDTVVDSAISFGPIWANRALCWELVGQWTPGHLLVEHVRAANAREPAKLAIAILLRRLSRTAEIIEESPRQRRHLTKWLQRTNRLLAMATGSEDGSVATVPARLGIGA